MPIDCFLFVFPDLSVETAGDGVDNDVGFGFIGWWEDEVVLAGDLKEVVEFLEVVA